ncbi:MAG: acyl-CoA dehydrogenase family protein [Bacteroidota bacterium]
MSALRRLRDERNPIGFDPAVWEEMVAMGWTSLTISEDYGGMDFGYTGMGQILEECGRTLVASPLVSTVLFGATIIEQLGAETQKLDCLNKIAEGQLQLALAIDDTKHHRPGSITTTATAVDGGFVINGQKSFVRDGHTAQMIILVACLEDGVGLFLVPSEQAGVKIERTIMMDSRNAAEISFDNVQISADALIGGTSISQDKLDYVLDIARIGLSAEMLGIMQEAFERTLAYLKEREQFGVKIGSFQALQHRTVLMYFNVELCKSLVLKALHAIDSGEENLAEIASTTKAKCCQAIQHITNESIQLFGGIGMTDEADIGFFLKRARVIQHTLGNANFHLDRLAKVRGY